MAVAHLRRPALGEMVCSCYLTEISGVYHQILNTSSALPASCAATDVAGLGFFHSHNYQCTLIKNLYNSIFCVLCSRPECAGL